MELAERFQGLREQAGLTKTAVARPRYTVSYVSQIESGKRRPSGQALDYFAGRLGVTPRFLATGVPEDIGARIELALESAEQHCRNGRGREAEQEARSALEQAERFELAGARARALGSLGRALNIEGKLHEAIDSYEAALRSGALSRRHEGQVIAALGGAYRSAGDLAYAADVIESYLSKNEHEAMDPAVMVELQAILISIYFERGDILKSERAARRAIAASTADLPHETRAIALWNASRVLAEAKRFDEALEYAWRARALMEEVDDLRRVARLHNAYAFICLEADPPRLEDARSHLDRSEVILGAMTLPADLAYVRTERSRLALLEGRFEDAISEVDQALAGAMDDEFERARGLFLKGRALVGLQRSGEALSVLVAAAELFERGGARQQQAACWREIGEIHLGNGDPDAAIDALRSGLHALDPRRSRA